MNGLERLGELVTQADRLARDPRLTEALAEIATDPARARLALTAPREFAAELGIEVPANLEFSFTRPQPGLPRDPLGGRYVPDFEFFSIRWSDCRTFVVAKRDDDGKIVGYDTETVCFGFEITPKFLPRGPWS
jgi:hypothetical protein